MNAPASLDQLMIPVHLDGSCGRNRASSRSQLTAADDRSAVLAWLARYLDSPATFANYRKEVERFLLWCVLQRGAALSDLTHEDLLLYHRFLENPQPAEHWVMGPGQKPARNSPRWRPFAGPLGPSSLRQALSILNAMFSWLVRAGYLAGNPLALSRRKHRQAAPRVSRFLPDEHWDLVKAAVEAMPASTERERLRASRCRWLFSLLYIGGLRVSEICAARMGGFFSRCGVDGRTRWWLEIAGKGNKPRLVPATGELMTELVRYRNALALSSLPLEGDETPLVMTLIAPIKPIARSAIHELVKEVMRAAAAALRSRGSGFQAAAAHLEDASTHWIRHTAASHLSEKADLKVVRDNLGHANISTTSIYLHADDDARHDATVAAHRLRWRTP
ncbi:tyrosine-type recombinase/integrase [Variovorax arabinosiphilus]|uniref:tyrosine-type recombinase/integrase n=1 Tax=Variovorax arabinosiphilus TaxID=3053498 RepID=UPI00257828D6|nr:MULTISPECIES: tyrosine-type recombinase/integrase [unclassified Variovorax]MDM0119006.1 tyrosine-type recombinase/integrase [Variovorax sp. J2L1-78]MDM0129432.1 tyrosine-type recombinase/integrase [Variovorax sp. J2L1-63]MDM0232782.1 tyrosine-type recombinase/integrase [Variovorax sp. J2R1-6]